MYVSSQSGGLKDKLLGSFTQLYPSEPIEISYSEPSLSRLLDNLADNCYG
jgi:hypothetical protein